MKGKEPRKIFGLNLSQTEFTLTLIVLSFTVVGGIWTTVSLAVTSMEKSAERNYRQRIQQDLSRPDGTIYLHIDEMMHEHDLETTVEMNKKLEEINIELSKQKVLLEHVYRATTGEEVPDLGP